MSKLFSPKIFIILMLLVFISGVIYLLTAKFLTNYKKPISPFQSLGPVTSEPVSLTLSLSSPDDNLLTFDGDVLVQGKTSKGATIIASSNDNDQVLQPGILGDFSATIKLQKGVNQLIITSFDNLGNSKSENRTIYYSAEKL